MESSGYNGRHELTTENKGYDKKRGLQRKMRVMTQNRVHHDKRSSLCRILIIRPTVVHCRACLEYNNTVITTVELISHGVSR